MSGGTASNGRGTLQHLVTAARYCGLTALLLGVLNPLAFVVLGATAFPHEAGGSLVTVDGRIVGSDLIGERWTRAAYMHGRPSAAGKSGYDPTATGGTNAAPASKALLDATRATIATLRRENPRATEPIPMDLVTSSASGIDPDIGVAAARYQAPRVAAARGVAVSRVLQTISAHERSRELGFLGEPRVNVLELNIALDAMR